MPLAFSTLGCPGDSLEQVVATALLSGATGVELRAADGEFVFPAMDVAQRIHVEDTLAAAGIVVLTLASYVRVCAVPEEETGANDPVLAELLAAVDLAADLSAAHVRVFPGAGLEPCGPGEEPSAELLAADKLGAARLNAAAAHARARGVTLLLETHDSHPRAQDIVRILAHVDADAPVQVIWDLMHPWRYDEAPELTAELLADSLAYAQYKDGIRQDGTNTVTLTLPGNGELPLVQMRDLAAGILANRGIADPWISLEWERMWHPHLPPVADALAALKTVLA